MKPDINTTDVLIAGAGPSGLMMACQLALRNIPFRIIDRKESITNFSGALLIHSRTMEIFYQMGIAPQMLNKATRLKGINFIFHNRNPLVLDLSNAGLGITRFPQILMLKQSDTEKILTDFIVSHGYNVERGTEFNDFSIDKNSVSSSIRAKNNQTEIIKSKYLIAADGGHSTIRKQLNIPFYGNSYLLSIFTLDCNTSVNFNKTHYIFYSLRKYLPAFFLYKAINGA